MGMQAKRQRMYLGAWQEAAAARAQRAAKQRIVEDAAAHRATSDMFHTWLWLYRAHAARTRRAGTPPSMCLNTGGNGAPPGVPHA